MGQKTSKPQYCDCLFLRWYYDGLYFKIPKENIKFDLFKPLDSWLVNKKDNIPVDNYSNWPITKSLVINLFDNSIDMVVINCLLKYLAECSLDYLYIKTATVDQMLFMLQNMSFVRIHTLILELDQAFYHYATDKQKQLYEAKILELKDTMDHVGYHRKIKISTLFYFATNNTPRFFGLSEQP